VKIRYCAELIDQRSRHQPAEVPHSPQNFAPLKAEPQFWQNFVLAAGAAACGVPQCWQNLPPPVSWPQPEHLPTA
jgi:hypothetical protein